MTLMCDSGVILRGEIGYESLFEVKGLRVSLKSLTQILTEKNLKNFKLFNNNYLVKNNSTILPLIDRNYSLLKTFI